MRDIKIDIEEIEVKEVDVVHSSNDVVATIYGVSLTELLDSIGEKTILEYYGIKGKRYDF